MESMRARISGVMRGGGSPASPRCAISTCPATAAAGPPRLDIKVALLPAASATKAITITVVTHQVRKPCTQAERTSFAGDHTNAAKPPANAARIPASAHHMKAPQLTVKASPAVVGTRNAE